MPTPAGKPKVGETIYTKDGKEIGRVIHRTPGNLYSIRILRPGQNYPSWLTEYEYWAEKNGWYAK